MVKFIPVPPSNGATILSMPLPQGFSLETSTLMFPLVVRQTRFDSETGAVLDITPAMTGIFTPEPGVTPIQNAPSSLEFVQTVIEPSSSPTFGGLDIGPPVPSLDEDQEPGDDDSGETVIP
jgi:hypothetical protein